eukprot:TRINITY_DN9892_c2_g1_i1.p1 TRINITY_DN9892_c2_g1~~TRINITY_DN9892_c2_g1_i1.p1  ORF type:complete len:456 (+),score=128.36 TRINITY_DN9892_c2_g1_i1:102-1469(+)
MGDPAAKPPGGGGGGGGGHFRGRKAVNKASIPWLKAFNPVKQYCNLLDEEVDAFNAFTALSNEELATRNVLVSEVSDAAAATTPGGGALLSGHAAIGISLPQSEVCVDVYGVDSACVDDFAAALQSKGFVIEAYWAHSFRAHRDDLGCCVIALCEGSNALVRVLQRRHNLYPLLGKVVKVLAQVLRQSNLLGEERGGIPQFALFVMVSAALEQLKRRQQAAGAQPRGNDEGLLEVVTYYAGGGFDPATTVLTLDGPEPRTEQPGSGLWVCNPVQPQSNLAEGCLRWVQARETIKYCKTMLGKWEGSTGGSGQSRRKPYSYKGKSPLSSVIAFKRVDPQLLPPPPVLPAKVSRVGLPPAAPQEPAAAQPPASSEELDSAQLAELEDTLQSLGVLPPPQLLSGDSAPGSPVSLLPSADSQKCAVLPQQWAMPPPADGMSLLNSASWTPFAAHFAYHA